MAFDSIQDVTLRIGWSSVRRIVLEATVVRRIVRRRDHDAVGEPCLPSAVVTQNRVGNGRSRRVRSPFRKHHLDVVGRKHFQRAGKCRLGQRVSVHSQEERPVNLLQLAVVANRLSDCEDVPLIERPVEGRAAMTGRAEDDALARVARIGPQRVVGRDEFRNIHQDGGISRLSGGGIHFHLSPRGETARASDRKTRFIMSTI